jgi:hypothetical protein
MRNLPPTLDDIEGRGDGEVQKAPPKNSRDPVVRSAESLGLWQEIDGDPLDFMFYTSNECCSVKLGTVFLASQIRAADDRRRNVRVVAPAAC